MRGAVELSNIHDVILVFQNGGFVVVDIQVVRGRENGHHTREPRRPGLSVHAVAGILCFMGSNDREEVVFFQEGARSGI